MTYLNYLPNHVMSAHGAKSDHRHGLRPLGWVPLARIVEENTMARMTAFNSPLLLGFEHLEQMLDRATRTSAEGYPPYNIEQTGEHGLRITLAVAGFSMDDLDVTIEDNQLIIRGQQEDVTDHIFIHRGIAARQFQRSFVLAEGIDVIGAGLDNGLLHIDLERIVPEPEIRNIPISQRDKSKKRPPKTIDVD